ncbi:putative membrane protein [Sphingobium sp. B7D2B]|uniref:DUF2244 domain-containing protein n=1 Tax=Sphingobium sp. B7D2B TaxID=2940583 RepID=UPI002225AF74|nr:DUF2244 domain-containing protein [Sphingobium sp. B7D2B]MCW2364607.1 putative membrane protein [Sphingobium sp. B7D2B]
MYQLLRRSSERPWDMSSHALDSLPPADNDSDRPLILHMQENRSHLTREARLCFSVIALLFMVTSLAPAMKGQWFVPAFSMLAMAGLTFALERHVKSRPASETLELDDGHIRHRDSAGRNDAPCPRE